MIVTIKKKLEETLIPEHLRAAGIIPVLAYDEDDHEPPRVSWRVFYL